MIPHSATLCAGDRKKVRGEVSWLPGGPWLVGTALLLAGAAMALAQQPQQVQQPVQQQAGSASAAPDPGPRRPWSNPSQLAVPGAQNSNFDAANAARRKEIAADSALLLKLATELKVEVDKTDKDTLSLKVIRKAAEIEKLAHDVKEKMKLSVSAN